MSTIALENWIRDWRGVTLSGSLFAALASVVYYKVPFIAATIPSWLFIGFFGLLGRSLQNGVRKLFQTMLPPIMHFLTFYERLGELTFLCRFGMISDDCRKEIAETVTRRRFLGSSKKPRVVAS